MLTVEVMNFLHCEAATASLSMARKRILILVHEDLVPPDSIEGMSDDEVNRAAWKTEFDVVATLREMGHEVQPARA